MLFSNLNQESKHKTNTKQTQNKHKTNIIVKHAAYYVVNIV